MNSLILPIVGGGIGLYVVTQSEKEEAAALQKPGNPGNQPGAGGQPLAVARPSFGLSRGGFGSMIQARGTADKPATGYTDPYGIAQYISQSEAQLEKRAKEEYDKLGAEAKKRGAEILNKQLKLNPPLKGDESYADVGATVGGTLAGGACAAYPVTAAAAPLCAIVGAYLGKAITEFVEDYYKDAERFVVRQARSVENFAERQGRTVSRVLGRIF